MQIFMVRNRVFWLLILKTGLLPTPQNFLKAEDFSNCGSYRPLVNLFVLSSYFFSNYY
jgi:hypothetical protein